MGKAIRQTTDGGYIIAGERYVSASDTQYVLLKVNPQGTMQWNKFFGGSGQDYAREVQQTSDGGYVIGGTGGKIGSSTDYGIYVVKTDANGNA
ncbi:MAG: hypothetical protein LUQ25_07520 [Methanoregulaceae archaeon]|nr:hypothetical protein [Methanoregulaceae archaeon]